MTALSAHSAKLADWIAANTGVGGAVVERELSGGNANLTVMLQSDTGALVLRTPPENTISPTAHRGIEREARVMKALQGHVKVPQVLAWCGDSDVIGRPFLLVSHVDGVSITDTLPAAYGDAGSCVDALGAGLIDELAAIHRAPWRESGLEGLGNPDGFLHRQISRWRQTRAETAVRDLPLLERLGDWLLQNIPAQSPVSLVHGDYHLDNTLSRRDRPELAAVIDWELATIGDPLTDLGLLLMFWGPRKIAAPGFAHIQAVSRGAGALSRASMAQRWAGLTGHSIDALPYYLCFAFWRLAAIVEGAYVLYRQGTVDSAYARGLEHDVPALLREAELAAGGDW